MTYKKIAGDSFRKESPAIFLYKHQKLIIFMIFSVAPDLLVT